MAILSLNGVECVGAQASNLGPPLASGWPETDSPRKMIATSGIPTKNGQKRIPQGMLSHGESLYLKKTLSSTPGRSNLTISASHGPHSHQRSFARSQRLNCSLTVPLFIKMKTKNKENKKNRSRSHFRNVRAANWRSLALIEELMARCAQCPAALTALAALCWRFCDGSHLLSSFHCLKR